MEKYKILVVDDDKEIRNAVINLLSSENYMAKGVASAHDALQILDETYSLVILDIMMPEKDGISTCIDIRKKYFMPILFLTAKNTENDKHISLSVGGDDFLEKPFSKVELLARVSSLKKENQLEQPKKASVLEKLHRYQQEGRQQPKRSVKKKTMDRER